jgi:hypothetical protein
MRPGYSSIPYFSFDVTRPLSFEDMRFVCLSCSVWGLHVMKVHRTSWYSCIKPYKFRTWPRRNCADSFLLSRVGSYDTTQITSLHYLYFFLAHIGHGNDKHAKTDNYQQNGKHFEWHPSCQQQARGGGPASLCKIDSLHSTVTPSIPLLFRSARIS